MRDDAGRAPIARPTAGERIAGVLRAGALVALLDGLFAVAVTAAVLGRPAPGRTFQGVARALLGPAAFDGGLATAALGAAMHVAVAYAWTGAYALLLARAPALRRAVATRGGTLAVSAGWGALVWCVMDLVVIPLTRARPAPVASATFAIMLAGHAAFVGLPTAFGVRPAAGRR